MVDGIYDDGDAYGVSSFPLDHNQNLQMVDAIYDDVYDVSSCSLDPNQILHMVGGIHGGDVQIQILLNVEEVVEEVVVGIPYPFLYDNNKDDDVARISLDHVQNQTHQSMVHIHHLFHHPIRDMVVEVVEVVDNIPLDYGHILQMVDISYPFFHGSDDVLVANNLSLDHDQILQNVVPLDHGNDGDDHGRIHP